MAKDTGELLLDGLIDASAEAEKRGNESLSKFLGELYQLAGEVVFDGPNDPIKSPCALNIQKQINRKRSPL
ncbi:hypothetical protein MNBD_ALPHA02-2492 [hydrothermal vent metagenome]|uniref:Uncharacterized protein n=1 Tax=hydrothermal vent metagenome TaxID=652676 RepID=A0A3B0RVA0_9ZZZZ